jgi:hypothetical protein
MLAQSSQEVFVGVAFGDEVEGEVGFSWAEADSRHLAFAASFVAVAVLSESDYGGAPHLGLDAGDALHELEEGVGVIATAGVLDTVEKRFDAGSGFAGDVLGHADSSV